MAHPCSRFRRSTARRREKPSAPLLGRASRSVGTSGGVCNGKASFYMIVSLPPLMFRENECIEARAEEETVPVRHGSLRARVPVGGRRRGSLRSPDRAEDRATAKGRGRSGFRGSSFGVGWGKCAIGKWSDAVPRVDVHVGFVSDVWCGDGGRRPGGRRSSGEKRARNKTTTDRLRQRASEGVRLKGRLSLLYDP